MHPTTCTYYYILRIHIILMSLADSQGQVPIVYVCIFYNRGNNFIKFIVCDLIRFNLKLDLYVS